MAANLQKVTPDEIAAAMMDRGASDNDLLDGPEFDPNAVAHAMAWACARFDEMPPFVTGGFTPENFPYKTIMINWASAYLLRAAALRLKRNQIDARTAAGTAIDYAGDKPQFYMSVAQSLQDDGDRSARRIKAVANMESGYGHI